MTTLPERLQDVIAEMRDDAERHAEKFADLSPRRVLAWANAIEAATALQAQEGGWVLVPREPTEAMLSAGIDRHWPRAIGSARLAMLYAAMLSAAPSPTAAQQAGEK